MEKTKLIQLIQELHNNDGVVAFYAKALENINNEEIKTFDFKAYKNILNTCINLILQSLDINEKIIMLEQTVEKNKDYLYQRGVNIISGLTFFCLVQPFLDQQINNKELVMAIYERINEYMMNINIGCKKEITDLVNEINDLL